MEQLVELARLVHAARHQDGVAFTRREAGLHAEVLQDVEDDLLQPAFGAEQLAQRPPALLQFHLGHIGETLGGGVEPLVNALLVGDALVDVPRFVPQVQHHLVLHSLVELVGVDVGAEDLQAGRLVPLQERGAREADEHRLRQDGLHGLVQPAALGAVALVHEHVQVALGLEALGQGAFTAAMKLS